MKKLSRNQPCDITGIRDYRMLDECGGIQWPWSGSETAETGTDSTKDTSPSGPHCERPDSKPNPERRLFENGGFFHPDGKARFIFETPRESPELVCTEYPFLLLTGRGTSAQWHTQTRTAKSAVLRQLHPENIYIEINPRDAVRLGIKPQQLVHVRSRRGVVAARAFLTATVQRGQVFIPMHYDTANQLTHPAFDPHSRQPSYKACAVAIRASSS
jgi:assimilatory nitrate reductase catalytic subunit